MNTIRSRTLGWLLTGATCLGAVSCGSEKPAPTGVAPIAEAKQAVGEVGNPACVPGGTHYTAGTPLFVDRTDEWGLAGVTGSRLTVADVNGDNYPDLVVREASDRESDFDRGRRPVWVMKNTRDGRFQDVTRASGLLLGRAPENSVVVKNTRASQVVVFADVDNDGDLDAFSGTRPYRPGGAEPLQHSEILLNNGFGGFTLSTTSLPATMRPGGATFLDRDRDGFIDLFVPSAQQRLAGTTVVNGWFLEGAGSATTRFATEQAQALGITGAGELAQSSVACDLNGDGRAELMLGTLEREPNGLYLGGANTFTDSSVPSGYAFDAQQDWQDGVYASAYCALVKAGQTAVRRLTFPEDCALALAQGVTACAACPCNVTPADDRTACTGVPDYPTASASRRASDASRWDHTRGRGTAHLGGSTFTTLCADFNGDGKLDLFNAEVRSAVQGASADPSEVLVNTSAQNGPVTFSRPGRAATNIVVAHVGERWTEAVQTAAAFDMDNDGRVDLYVGGSDHDAASNVGHLFHNTSTGSLHFDEVPSTDAFRHLRSQGVAVGDFDRDGDLDLVLGYSRLGCDDRPAADAQPESCQRTEQVRFFENQYGSGGNWVAVKLVGGTGTNRAAIGARVTLELDNGLKLVQEVDGGHGHFGAQEDHVLHFGLGGDCSAEITVRWPDGVGAGTEETFPVTARHHYRIVQGSGQARELPLKGFCRDDVTRLTGPIGRGLGNDYADVFCVQDRLSALGFLGKPVQLALPDAETLRAVTAPHEMVPQSLNVNGAFTEDTEWAIKTFQAATARGPHTNQSGRVSPTSAGGGALDFATYRWLNARNAPNWVELPSEGGPGWINSDVEGNRDNHDWGTSFALDVIRSAGAALHAAGQTSLLVNDLSRPGAGVTPAHPSSHQGGLEIDVRLTAAGGRWFDIDAATKTLGVSGTFWSTACPRPTLPETGPELIDETMLWLWSTDIEACRAAVTQRSTLDPKTFRDGFDKLVSKRSDYDRTAISEKIKAFLDQELPGTTPVTYRVRRIIFQDPVLMGDLGLNAVYRSRLNTAIDPHTNHFHVELEVPPLEP